MAGIGFELRKLFSEKDKAFGDVKAIAYSSIVSVGPWIITSISLNIIVFLAGTINLGRAEKVTYTSTILYAFIFSQLLTGPFQYLITRYISDCVFTKKIDKIRGAYIGVVKLIVIIGFFMSYFFIRKGDFSGNYKASFVILFITMSLSWITMIFISLLKNYNFMIKSFFAGNAVSVISAYIFLKYPVSFLNEPPIFWMLFSYTLGIFLNFLFTSLYLLKIFKGENKGDFEFLTYLRGYLSLLLVGLFYAFAVWAHIIINWFLGDSYFVGNVFLISPLYEVAVFYAFCTSIPSMVYFMIFLETKFLPVYKNYYQKIFYTGNYSEVNTALKKMYDTLNKEILYCMELQFIISLTFVLTSNVIFDYLRLDLYLLDIFRLTILSAYCAVFISIFITIFLYFDSREYAVLTAFIFFITGVGFSYFFGVLGKEYVGLGFFFSSFITFGIANVFNKKIFNNLNYITMFKRNFNIKIGSSFLRLIDKLMGKKIYLLIIFALLFLLSGCSSYDKNGFNNITKRNWHSMSNYDPEGYDFSGLDANGLNRRGFNAAGWNEATDSPYDYAGFDSKNIHRDTGEKFDERGFNYKKYNILTCSPFDKNGFDYEGIHKITKREFDPNGWNYYGLNEKTQDYYNEKGFDRDGYDKEGYNKKGYTRENIDRRGFNEDGWNIETNSRYDSLGFTIKNIHKDTNKKFDERGFDYKKYNILTNSLYDKNGFDYDGIHKVTKNEFDLNGWNYYGLNKYTKTYYAKNGYTYDGLDRDGYTKYNRPPEMGNTPLKDEANDGIDRSWMDKDGFNKDGIYIGGY